MRSHLDHNRRLPLIELSALAALLTAASWDPGLRAGWLPMLFGLSLPAGLSLAAMAWGLRASRVAAARSFALLSAGCLIAAGLHQTAVAGAAGQLADISQLRFAACAAACAFAAAGATVALRPARSWH